LDISKIYGPNTNWGRGHEERPRSKSLIRFTLFFACAYFPLAGVTFDGSKSIDEHKAKCEKHGQATGFRKLGQLIFDTTRVTQCENILNAAKLVERTNVEYDAQTTPDLFYRQLLNSISITIDKNTSTEINVQLIESPADIAGVRKTAEQQVLPGHQILHSK
jgi:hypothetical protein